MRFKAVIKDKIWRFKNLGFKKTNYGTKLKINSFMDHLVFKEIFIDRIYDDSIHYALNNSNIDDRIKILDLGANIGFFTIRCCEILRQMQLNNSIEFILFEPSSTCIDRIKVNIKSFLHNNNFSFIIKNNLVGKKTGDDWFIEDVNHHLGQCVSEKIERKGDRYSRKIDYHDLSYDLEHSIINLLKCDIEGSEIEFLSNYGNNLQNVSHIIIETHGQDSESFVRNYLKDKSFKIHGNKLGSNSEQFKNLFFSSTLLK